MSTNLKEWLQQTIAELEEERDATPGAVNEDAAMALAAMKLALASLEAESVAWDYEWASYITCEGPQDFNRIIEREAPPEWAIEEGQARNIIPLYAAPPAPVSVPDELSREEYKRLFMQEDNFNDTFRGGWNACRAAMLQGAGDEIGSWHNDKNTPASHTCDEHIRYESNAGGSLWIQCSKQKYERMKAAGMLTRVLYERPQNQQQNIPENIPTLREAVDTIRNSGIESTPRKILAERDALNGPVIPDGWVLVPIDATRAMIDAAARVEEVGYDAMHKAMIAAAPLQEA